jgi:hypothetical protein
MKMRPLEGGLALPVGHDVSLAPGGIHIMVMGLGSPLEEGARHPPPSPSSAPARWRPASWSAPSAR